MNPLQELTPRAIEDMKDVFYKKSVIAQGLQICDLITKTIECQAKYVNSIKSIKISDKHMYPENIALLVNNGFHVYKITGLYKVTSAKFIEYFITWDDENFEKDVYPHLYRKDEYYTILDYKEL